MSSAKKITKSFEIPSEIAHIKEISKDILAHLQHLKIDESIQFDVRLAIEEALRNAIEHGHRYKKGLPITISYTLDKDGIEIEVEDRGEGFDLKKISDPRTGENLMKGGGRGIFLMFELMDEVRYNKKGNKVRMIKYFK